MMYVLTGPVGAGDSRPGVQYQAQNPTPETGLSSGETPPAVVLYLTSHTQCSVSGFEL